jgi:hypothetical protein
VNVPAVESSASFGPRTTGMPCLAPHQDHNRISADSQDERSTCIQAKEARSTPVSPRQCSNLVPCGDHRSSDELLPQHGVPVGTVMISRASAVTFSINASGHHCRHQRSRFSWQGVTGKNIHSGYEAVFILILLLTAIIARSISWRVFTSPPTSPTSTRR